MSYASTWFNPDLDTSDYNVGAAAVEAVAFLTICVQMCNVAMEIPKRLPNANRTELANDKRKLRRIRHGCFQARKRIVALIPGMTLDEAADSEPPPEVRQKGAQVDVDVWSAGARVVLEEMRTAWATANLNAGTSKAANRGAAAFGVALYGFGARSNPEAAEQVGGL